MASFIDTSSLLPQVASSGIPDDYQRVQSSPDTFGAGFGRALEGAGNDLAASAGFWGKVTADNAYNDYADKVTKLAYGDPNNPKQNPDGTTTPDTGYFGMRGRDALTARPQIEAQMSSAFEAARSKLPSPEAQLQFDQNARRLHTMMSERVGSHADQQSFEFARATNSATDSIHLNAIASNPNDDKLFETHLEAVVGAAQQNAQISHGAHPGDDEWKAAGVDATARAWDARLVSIAATDPVKAQKMLADHRNEVGDKFAALEGHIRARATAANGDEAADQAIHEASHGAPPPPGAPRVQNAVAVGDSTADGVKSARGLSGDTLVGRPSADVLTSIKTLPQSPAPGTPLVIGTGLMNDAGPKADLSKANPAVVADQIAAAKAKGYSPVILGVGDKYAAINPQIQKIAETNGAKFVPLGPNDGTHPTDNYKTATQGALGGSVGGQITSGPAANIDPSIPPEGRALLSVISGPESAGQYNVRYGGAHFDGYADHPRIHERIANGPNAGNVSDAAGRYQFISSTWDAEKAKLGLTDFSPKSQDIAAWDLAQSDYKKQTGRDLLGDLRSNDPATMSRVAQTLRLTWTSLPGGIEAGTTQTKFERAFRAAMNGEGQTYAPSQVAGGAQGPQAPPSTLGADRLPVTDAAFTPPMPGVVQGVTPQVASARQVEADAIRRVEARTDLDDEVKQHAISRIQRVSAAAAMAAEEDTKSREEAAKTATVDYMRRIHQGDIKAVNDMYNDPRLASDPGAIRELQTFAQQAGIEDKQSYGPGFQPLMNRMLLPFGDPNRISTPEQILKMANGEPGTLTSAGADRLLKLQGELQKPDEFALRATAAGVLNGVKKQISFQGEGQFDPKDPKGEAAFNLKFVPSFWSAFDAWRAEGKNPWDFLKDDKTINALVKAAARKPDEMKWDQLQAEGAQIVTDPNAEKLPVPAAPPNVDATAWTQTLSQRKFVVNTPKGYVQPTPQAWAKVLGGLVSDPSPENIDRFNNSMWGKAAGNDGAALVKKLAVSAAVPPLPAATPEAAPAPVADQSGGLQNLLRQGFSNLTTTPEERERQAKAKVEAVVGPQPEPSPQRGGFMDALGDLLTNPDQNQKRKEEKRKRHIAEGREPPP